MSVARSLVTAEMSCIVAMSVMAVGLVWQAEIIAHQQEAIRWLETLKFGG